MPGKLVMTHKRYNRSSSHPGERPLLHSVSRDRCRGDPAEIFPTAL